MLIEIAVDQFGVRSAPRYGSSSGSPLPPLREWRSGVAELALDTLDQLGHRQDTVDAGHAVAGGVADADLL
jgi:hypothetical protein